MRNIVCFDHFRILRAYKSVDHKDGAQQIFVERRNEEIRGSFLQNTWQDSLIHPCKYTHAQTLTKQLIYTRDSQDKGNPFFTMEVLPSYPKKKND